MTEWQNGFQTEFYCWSRKLNDDEKHWNLVEAFQNLYSRSEISIQTYINANYRSLRYNRSYLQGFSWCVKPRHKLIMLQMCLVYSITGTVGDINVNFFAEKAGFLKNCSFSEIKQTQAENNVQAVHIFMEKRTGGDTLSRWHKQAVLSALFVFMEKMVSNCFFCCCCCCLFCFFSSNKLTTST